MSAAAHGVNAATYACLIHAKVSQGTTPQGMHTPGQSAPTMQNISQGVKKIFTRETRFDPQNRTLETMGSKSNKPEVKFSDILIDRPVSEVLSAALSAIPDNVFADTPDTAPRLSEHGEMLAKLRDAEAESDSLKAQWEARTESLARSFAEAFNGDMSNDAVFLYRVCFRNVYQDQGYAKQSDFYRAMADRHTTGRSDASVYAHYHRYYTIGREIFGAPVTTTTKTPKAPVDKISGYLTKAVGTLNGQDASVVTDEQLTDLRDAVSATVNAVNALIERRANMSEKAAA